MDVPGAGRGHTRSGCHLGTDGHPRDQLWLSRAAGAWPGAASQKYPEPQLGLGTRAGNTAEPHGPEAELSHAPRTDGQLSPALPRTIPAASLSPPCVKLLELLPPPKHCPISSLQRGTDMDLQEGPAELSRPPGRAGEHHPNLIALGVSSEGVLTPNSPLAIPF